VYRFGGDEFCALIKPGTLGTERVTALAASALSESGDAFTVTASHGAAVVPHDATDPAEALQLADSRMYAQKGGSRASTVRQTRDVLLRTLREHVPQLHEHAERLVGVAVGVGRDLGMSSEHLDELGRAAELHDVGKMGIPDAILCKPGPLNSDERSFVERHAIIGEQILGAAPALRPVAKIVRASHERWDGQGYPDGLSATEIPVGARIVSVCDAYFAMTSDRPYRRAMSPQDAVAELRHCAGSQFDPTVVEVFLRIVGKPGAPEPVATAALG
jgi:HD-GYP domain-containing protein (c-di-GMP phosphodiesterase class II)